MDTVRCPSTCHLNWRFLIVRSLLLLDRIWGFGHRPFEITGEDTIIAVSPFENTLFTCEPELVVQLLRNQAFGKPTKLLGLLNVFGPSLTGTDGQENRHLRKVTSPFFHNRTMNKVLRETITATEDFLGLMGSRTSPIDSELRPTLAKMALHILGRAAFEKQGSCTEELKFNEICPKDHKMSFADTLLGIDQDLPLIALTPPAILKYSPFQIHKRGYLLYSEMRNYLNEAVEQKRSSSERKDADSKSLLDILVDASDNKILSQQQVTGNIFIVNFAGHDPNAQGILFALLNLACRPELQILVQRDIDQIVGDLQPRQWNYEQHYTPLAESMVGAVINESLRLYSVIPVLVKHTTDAPVTVTVAGREHVIPPKTIIFVNTSATHRNPRFWPTPTGAVSEGTPFAASSFDPQQWLPGGKNRKFLVPEPGSFIPFSDGTRGCLGQRFAMVELVVTLARILKDHSVELAVDASGGDNAKTKKRKWEEARANARFQLSGGIVYKMTLRMSGKVPVKFVRRGEEEFYAAE